MEFKMVPIESNNEKFTRLAESRVTKIIKDIRSLGKLSDSSNYSYEDKDVKKIISTLKSEVTQLHRKFENSSSNNDVQFKL